MSLLRPGVIKQHKTQNETPKYSSEMNWFREKCNIVFHKQEAYKKGKKFDIYCAVTGLRAPINTVVVGITVTLLLQR